VGAISSFASGAAASISSLGSSFESAWADAKAAWSEAEAYFTGIASSVSSVFESMTSSMSGIGQNLWSSMKSGLESAVSEAGEWAENMVDEVKSKLGIHSPSKVFAEIGRNMALGLDEGWNSAVRSVKTDIASSVGVKSGSVDFASSSLGKSSSAQINTILSGMSERGGNYNINLVVDGRTLANVVFDPLNNISKQKGVAVGA
jgi:phage-related protein